jgi:hypothetical protein
LLLSQAIKADPLRLIGGEYSDYNSSINDLVVEIFCKTECESTLRSSDKNSLLSKGRPISALHPSPELVAEVNLDIAKWNASDFQNSSTIKNFLAFKKVLPLVDSCFKTWITRIVTENEVFDMGPPSSLEYAYPTLICGHSSDRFLHLGHVYKSAMSDVKGFLPGSVLIRVSAN